MAPENRSSSGKSGFICKLRRKLADAGADNLIGTVWGRGYMMRDPAPARADLPAPLAKPAEAPLYAGAAA